MQATVRAHPQTLGAQNFRSDNDRLLSTKEAAEYLNLSVSSIEKHRFKGTGPCYYRYGTRKCVYKVSDLETWLETNKIIGTR